MSIFKKRIWKDRVEALRLQPRFFPIEFAFGLISLFSNPYRVCRKFLQKKQAVSIYAYGETPFMTYQRIAAICEIGPKDIWIEPGAGRGKGCFWMSQITNCRAIGIEWIPQFVWIAKTLKFLFRKNNVTFHCQDIEKANLHQATAIYLYGIWPVQPLPNGVKIISISEPLPGFEIKKKFWVRYPWGRTHAYLQEKNESI